ncbi:MAG: methylenetetrahydrofolate reductase [Chloroflexi bacterium]|nr:methylenetetrahydrofolate reductase [Chloroflexota bacterium]
MFARRLAAGQFVVTGELSPPRDADATTFLQRLADLRPVLDAVNLTDNPGAAVRASPLAAAALARSCGVEPILQLTCRDRNRLALQSEILGAALLGVPAILAMTGDPITTGDQPEARPVFELDSFGLIQLIVRLRRGELASGRRLAHPPRLLVGGAEAPFAGPIHTTVDRLERKVEAGAEFIQTQFIWEVDRFAEWLAEVRRRGLHQRVKILAGVGILHSARAARWLGDHLGQLVPAPVLAQLSAAASGTELQVGIASAASLISRLRELEGLAGVHLLPVGGTTGLRPTVERAGLLPRPPLPAPSPAPA